MDISGSVIKGRYLLRVADKQSSLAITGITREKVGSSQLAPHFLSGLRNDMYQRRTTPYCPICSCHVFLVK